MEVLLDEVFSADFPEPIRELLQHPCKQDGVANRVHIADRLVVGVVHEPLRERIQLLKENHRVAADGEEFPEDGRRRDLRQGLHGSRPAVPGAVGQERTYTGMSAGVDCADAVRTGWALRSPTKLFWA